MLPHLRDPVALVLAIVLICAPAAAQIADWSVTEGAPGGGRFSPLTDITRENVSDLEVAWTYRHGDFWKGSFPLEVNRGSAFESTPIVVDGRQFLVVAPGGHIGIGSPLGDHLIAYALPDPGLAPPPSKPDGF